MNATTCPDCGRRLCEADSGAVCADCLDDRATAAVLRNCCIRNDEEILRFMGGYHAFDVYRLDGSGFYRVGLVDTPGYCGSEVVRAVESDIVTGNA